MAETVVAVVVTYNRLEKLIRCLDSLLNQTFSCSILVIDNASTDGTGQYLSDHYSGRIDYYNTGANIGGAGGFNIGMRRAVEEGFSYVWIMDDDCIPDTRALEKLMEANCLLGGPEHFGFISSAVLWTDGHECIMNRQKLTNDYYRYVELLQHGIVSIKQATFVSLLFPAKTIRQFGLPYKEYFIWGDDIEYTRRIAVLGSVPCFLAGQSRIVHAMEKNIGSDISIDDITRLSRYTLAVRNEYFTYHKQGFYGICLYYFRCFRAALRICLKSEDHKLLRMKALVSGMLSGPFFRPKVEYPLNETSSI